MEKPIEPKFTDFGLTETAVKALPKIGQPSCFLGVASFIALLGYWTYRVYEHSHSFLFAGLVGYILFLFPAGIVGVIVYYTSLKIEDKYWLSINPHFVKYTAYQSAVEAYKQASKEFEQWTRRRQEDFWRSLSGVQFEVELGKLFTAMGYHVQQTPVTGDGGVDLIVRKNGHLTVIQCKAHQKKIAIGTIRELSASIKDFKAHDAIIACFEGVTKPVHEYIKDKPITVLTVHQIVELQRKIT